MIDRIGRGLLMSSAAVAIVAATPAMAQTRNFNVPAQAAETGIAAFGRQADIQIVAARKFTKGKRTNAVRGAMTVEAALQQLLEGTGLTVRATGAQTYMVVQAGNGAAADSQPSPETVSGFSESGSAGISEILVVGARSQNVDIRRTKDDAQPYVVFTREDIQNSNATSVDDFLRTRLPQNAQRQSINQIEVAGGAVGDANVGQIDLRGLGSGQTLILVDGRRQPGTNFFDIQQANVNGIPLSAIERIEVLPSTAGAIYGGSAIGGVVNIILRRDYRGIEARLDYGNTFDGATGDFKASAVGGFHIGSTRIMFRASRERTGELTLAERNKMLVRSREFLLANNPAAFAPPLMLAGGLTGNICSSSTSGTCNSTPLVLDNGTPLNASITYIPEGYAGPASDGGAALISNAGRYRIDAPAGKQTLVQGTRMESVGVSVSQSLTQSLELFGDASWDRVRGKRTSFVSLTVPLAANSPLNPFQQNISVRVPLPNIFGQGTTEVETLRLNGGIIARLPHGWSFSLEQGWAKSQNASFSRSLIVTSAARAALAPFALSDVGAYPPPDIASLLSPSVTFFGPTHTTSTNSSLRLAGPLLRLPGGMATATLLAERRLDRIGTAIQATLPSYALLPPRRQEVRSLYMETRLPIVGADSAIPTVHSLELQGSLRYDHYESLATSDQFILSDPDAPHAAPNYFTNRLESLDYLVGLKWTPVEGVILRGSYSTGFLPPAVSQLSPLPFTVAVTQVAAISDPRRGGEDLVGDLAGNVLVTSGGDPNLNPEKSRSFSLGMILEPRFMKGLRVSADYTDIRKTDEIAAISLQQLIDNEESFPGRINRGPNRPGDPAGYAGPIVGYYLGFLNVANTRSKAWDFQLDYNLETRFGRFQPYAIATYQTTSARSLAPGDPFISRLGFANGPLRWRGNIGVNWSSGGLFLGWNMQFYDGYRICSSTNSAATCTRSQLNQGGTRVPAQSYHDIAVRYEVGERQGLLAGTEISAGIQNLFNHRPPPIGVTGLTGFYSSYGDIRLRRFTVSLRRRFGL